jgi:hypothetical protein
MGYEGFGEVEPTGITAGGDYITNVEDISWQSWGDPQATGTAVGDIYAPQGGPQDETATVVASDLGRCPDGTYAYQTVGWYLPALGQTSLVVNCSLLDPCNGTWH